MASTCDRMNRTCRPSLTRGRVPLSPPLADRRDRHIEELGDFSRGHPFRSGEPARGAEVVERELSHHRSSPISRWRPRPCARGSIPERGSMAWDSCAATGRGRASTSCVSRSRLRQAVLPGTPSSRCGAPARAGRLARTSAYGGAPASARLRPGVDCSELASRMLEIVRASDLAGRVGCGAQWHCAPVEERGRRVRRVSSFSGSILGVSEGLSGPTGRTNLHPGAAPWRGRSAERFSLRRPTRRRGKRKRPERASGFAESVEGRITIEGCPSKRYCSRTSTLRRW